MSTEETGNVLAVVIDSTLFNVMWYRLSYERYRRNEPPLTRIQMYKIWLQLPCYQFN